MDSVIPELDRMSALNLTSEHDLVDDHPDIHFIPMPFDIRPFELKENGILKNRIIHAPSDRYNKGTDYILPLWSVWRKNLILSLC